MKMVADDLELSSSLNLLQHDIQGTISPFEVVCRRILGRSKHRSHFIVLHPVMFYILKKIGFEGHDELVVSSPILAVKLIPKLLQQL